MSSIVIDIETEGLPADELRKLFDPPAAPAHPGEFDQSSVKLGQMKDLAKIQAKIDDEKAKHEKAVAEHDTKCKTLVADAWAAFVDRAALSPLTGRVLCVGVMQSDGKHEILEGEEAEIIERTFREVERAMALNAKIIGHCSNKFDFPFLIKRAWKLGLDLPDRMFPEHYWGPQFIDLNKRWQVGNAGMDGKLDEIAKFFGLQGKLEGITGGQFAGLYHDPKTRPQALEYLRRDLLTTLQVAIKMQVL